MTKRIILKTEIGIEILNEDNFNDFNTPENTKLLVQELIDQSVWPLEGFSCEVISAEAEEI